MSNIKFTVGTIVSVVERPRGVRLDGNGVANTSERVGGVDKDIGIDEELTVLEVQGAKALCLRSEPGVKFPKVWVHRNHVFQEAAEKYKVSKLQKQGQAKTSKSVDEQIAELEKSLQQLERLKELKAKAEMAELEAAEAAEMEEASA